MRRPTVLIVDDEDIVLRSLKTELKETVGDAYRIDVAETAASTVLTVKPNALPTTAMTRTILIA